MVQPVHIASNGAASIPVGSEMPPERDCEQQNQNMPGFQRWMLFRCGLFKEMEADASNLLLLAQCMP
jgi:hypothetical protein